jgi:hypothetical protein
MPKHARTGSVVLALLASAVVFACTQNATPPPKPNVMGSTTPYVPPPSSSATPTTAAGCEDLGTISNMSLTAYIGGITEAAAFALPNRPETTKVAAVGETSSMVGQPVVLGSGAEANFATCSHCLVLAIGCTTDCSSAAWFFARSGTVTFSSVATSEAAPSASFQGDFENVDLEQVSVNGNTYTSTPVPGGACLHIDSFTFSAKPGGEGTGVGVGSSSGNVGVSSSASSTSGAAGASGGAGCSGACQNTADPGNGSDSSGVSDPSDVKSDPFN